MPIVDLVMPKLGESIMEATILKWHKNVGDTIQLDETLLDIATDKVDSEIPSTTAGKVVELLYNINDVVPIGAVIAKIETSDSVIHTNVTQTAIITKSEPVLTTIAEPITNKVPNVPAEKQQPSEVEVPYTPTVFIAPSSATSEGKFYSPLVMNIAQNEGISMQELEQIPGTGSLGRVSKKDILAYVANKKSALVSGKIDTNIALDKNINDSNNYIDNQLVNNISISSSIDEQSLKVPANIFSEPFQTNAATAKFAHPDEVILTGSSELVEMDRMRKVIAKHMVDSVQTSPHVTSFIEADVTNMFMWREKVKLLFEKREGTKLTYTPMFLECIARSLEQFPIINSSLQGDHIVYKKDINIGMATALPSGNLIVPVIKGANQLSIVGLSKAVNGLANAARNNQLKPQDTQGGTFTVTNVGTFGSLMGTPIINQPQVAVLALGAIKKRAVVVETPLGDAIVVRHMMFLSMSYDHRIVDGSAGSKFLAAVAKSFEDWDPNRQWFQYV